MDGWMYVCMHMYVCAYMYTAQGRTHTHAQLLHTAITNILFSSPDTSLEPSSGWYTYVLIHSYTHTLIHSYTHTLIHSYTRTLIHAYTHIPIQMRTHTRRLYVYHQLTQRVGLRSLSIFYKANTHTIIHKRLEVMLSKCMYVCVFTSYTQSYLMHSYTHTLIHSYTHYYIHSYTHTLIHSYTHTLIHSYTHAHTLIHS